MKNKPGFSNLAHSHPLLWQGRSSCKESSSIATGFPVLDRAIPAGGWPRRALVEISVPYWGMGELRLLLPAMARLNQRKRRIMWIAPPYLPYAPALISAGLNLEYVMVVDAQAGNISWAMERALCAEACGMVLAWPSYLTDLETRRLQLAAEVGNTTGIVLHTIEAKWQAKTAALRLCIEAKADDLAVKITKARGSCQSPWIRVSL